MSMSRVTVFFDYTCPFAYRAHHWLAQLDDVVTVWRPFSLLERNYRGDGPPVWRLTERTEDISLLLFAGHCWVDSDRDGDLRQYRHQAFHAWHHSDTRLGPDDVVALARAAGATGGADQLREHFFDAEAVHDGARRLGVFGSPTLVFDSGAVFVKLEETPRPGRARRVLEAVATLAELPSVLEVKRPTAPDPPAQDGQTTGAAS